MYPRNAASPERIGVGAVVQISDGAVQTSGVSISVRGQGGASGAGAGTTAYDNGIVEYTPTQGETDFTSFVVVAYKTGCIPVAATVITSASATAGYAGVDWGKVTNATSTVDLSGTNIKTNQKVDVETIKTQTVTCAAGVTVLASVGTAATSTAQTGDSYALANGANGFVALKSDTAAILDDTGTSGVVVAAASKSGYALTATTGLGNQTANITGNLSGSVGSVTGAVGSVTGSVGSVTGAVGSVTGAVGSVTGLTASDVNAIKVQTDKFVFTVANQVDANVQYVNDVQINGTGAAGNEWGP